MKFQQEWTYSSIQNKEEEFTRGYPDFPKDEQDSMTLFKTKFSHKRDTPLFQRKMAGFQFSREKSRQRDLGQFIGILIFNCTI